MNDIGGCDKTAYGWHPLSPDGATDDATYASVVKTEFPLDDDMFDISKVIFVPLILTKDPYHVKNLWGS
ncbi:unnamed protein product [Strongylus vulgaris]|uniref:Uncharacterized protein n=2 Tax=Strongylus vulgaris TaxID=40348 RepID=A0A3P7J3Y4_STRVU|nr:unnamed protein product [Strongylus vulgaris]